RIVMPGSTYTAPPEQHKADPLDITRKRQLFELISSNVQKGNSDDSASNAFDVADDELAITSKMLVNSLSGFSPLLATETIFRALTGVQEPLLEAAERPLQLTGLHARSLEIEDKDALWNSFDGLIHAVRQGLFKPMIATDKHTEKAYFSVVALTHIEG